LPVDDLIGNRVIVTFTDPWDFVTDNGESAAGMIVEVRERELLLELDRLVAWEGKSTTLLIARPRHREVDVCALKVGAEIACNMTGVAGTAGPLHSPANALFAVIGGVRLL
jgi:hypothetical protein